LVITAAILIIPLFIYSFFNEIRQTLNGKLCIALLITQIYVIFAMSLENLEMLEALENGFHMFTIIFYCFGAFSSMFVVNLMCFDILLTFRHFREPHYQSTYFKKFVCFLLIFFVAATLLTYLYSPLRINLSGLYDLMSTAADFTFILTCAMNILALIAAFYYLIALTRSTTLSENTRFDLERERFWMYIKLFAIITVSWFVELWSGMMWNSYESFVISDVIKCYSAGIAAFILIWTPRVHTLVFKRCSGMKDDDAENN
jgi:G protein-coupled receptor Mth (Methuselah protein)